MKNILTLTALAVALAGTAFADSGKACTCQNLESLQQETENAAYEAQFFKDMAGQLKAIEDKQADLNANHPTDPDSGRSVLVVSGQARDRIMQGFYLPHAQVKDYSGPTSVALQFGTCKNSASDLDGLAKGAPCKEIGDLTLRHEAEHRAICEKMGADAYWARLPSLLATEEADRYAAQAKAMRDALKHVIDVSTVEIDTISQPVIAGHGFKAVYKYVLKKTKVSGKSSPGKDSWDLKGEGTRKGTIESVSMAGVSCTSTGALTDAISLTLSLDGFKMSLGISSRSQGDDVKLKCTVPGVGSGVGESMRPMGEGGEGAVFADLPVQLDTTSTDDLGKSAAADIIRGGGMSMTGQEVTTVTISCPAP